MRTHSWLCPAVLGLAASVPMPLAAQDAVQLGTVVAAFLADSGVRTRGLPWTSGSALPIRWESPAPVANPDQHSRGKGLTLSRSGTVRIQMDTATIDVTVELLGNPAGLQQVRISWSYQGDFDPAPLGRAERALKAEGYTLGPLKCDRKTEGVTYGNVAYTTKAPGKTASGLWAMWNCTGTGDCSLVFTILYRRTDLTQVECSSG